MDNNEGVLIQYCIVELLVRHCVFEVREYPNIVPPSRLRCQKI
jgi:hypothetical protein